MIVIFSFLVNPIIDIIENKEDRIIPKVKTQSNFWLSNMSNDGIYFPLGKNKRNRIREIIKLLIGFFNILLSRLKIIHSTLHTITE